MLICSTKRIVFGSEAPVSCEKMNIGIALLAVESETIALSR